MMTPQDTKATDWWMVTEPPAHLREAPSFSMAAWRHSLRFREVSNRYPRMVAMAYGRDLAAAMADSDEQVAATVAEWERREGLPIRDWYAIGAYERDELEELDDVDVFGPTAQAVTR